MWMNTTPSTQRENKKNCIYKIQKHRLTYQNCVKKRITNEEEEEEQRSEGSVWDVRAYKRTRPKKK